jgi:sugar lactone lactonase YvrE
VTEIVAVSELLTDLSFTHDGATLFVADYFHGQVQLVTPEGAIKPIGPTLQGIDGIVAGRTDDFVYVSESLARRITRINCESGETRTLAEVATGPGPGVTGMLRDHSGALIYTGMYDEARMLEYVLD